MDTPDRSPDGVIWAPELALNTLTEKLRNELDLNSAEIGDAVTLLLTSEVDDQVKAEFLTALHDKGETAEEIAAFVRALMKRAVDPMIAPADMPGPMVDVCGTGGDGLDLFNVSTTVAFVVAAGGAVVVKHGNRRVTSSCGGADVLEQLGVPIDLPPEQLRESLKRHGIGFLFARQYHPAFRTLAEMRERLARQNVPTILDVSWLGIPRAPVGELQGGDARGNAVIVEGILAGNIAGAKRDMAIVNAAGGFVVAGLARDIKEGIELAREEIDSGRALEKLRALQNYRAK